MKAKSSLAVKLLNFLLNLVLGVVTIGSVLTIVATLNPPYSREIGRLIFTAYCLVLTLPYMLIMLIFVVLPVLWIAYQIVKRVLYVVHLIANHIKRKAE